MATDWVFGVAGIDRENLVWLYIHRVDTDLLNIPATTANERTS